jgi:hypothetical protein
MPSDESKNNFKSEKQTSNFTVGLGHFSKNFRHLF